MPRAGNEAGYNLNSWVLNVDSQRNRGSLAIFLVMATDFTRSFTLLRHLTMELSCLILKY